MILCLDAGNSHLYGGVFDGPELILRFRHTSAACTSDMLGLFLKQVLLENGCDPTKIQFISIASVVPAMDYSLRAACIKYFSIEPFFLQAAGAVGLTIQYHHPAELGADRIATALAAVKMFPAQHVIIMDFGTATTFGAVTADQVYVGGAILPGVRLAVEALAKNTARLPSVEILKMTHAVGRGTVESIQSGIFYSMVGACKELITRFKHEAFHEQAVTVVATGGFASLFEREGIYDHHMPDLVLEGLHLAAQVSKQSMVIARDVVSGEE